MTKLKFFDRFSKLVKDSIVGFCYAYLAITCLAIAFVTIKALVQGQIGNLWLHLSDWFLWTVLLGCYAFSYLVFVIATLALDRQR